MVLCQLKAVVDPGSSQREGCSQLADSLPPRPLQRERNTLRAKAALPAAGRAEHNYLAGAEWQLRTC